MELNVKWNGESNFIQILYEVKNNLIKIKFGQTVVQNSTRHKFTQKRETVNQTNLSEIMGFIFRDKFPSWSTNKIAKHRRGGEWRWKRRWSQSPADVGRWTMKNGATWSWVMINTWLYRHERSEGVSETRAHRGVIGPTEYFVWWLARVFRDLWINYGQWLPSKTICSYNVAFAAIAPSEMVLKRLKRTITGQKITGIVDQLE